jgi:hypothetical protein
MCVICLFWQASESAAKVALSQLSLDAEHQEHSQASSLGKPGTSTLPIPPQQWYQHQQQQQPPFSAQTFHLQQHSRKGTVSEKITLI